MISILGYSVLYLFYTKNKETKISLEIFLFSFALGNIIYFIYSYMIVTFYIFNIFTIYLPLIFSSIICIVLLYFFGEDNRTIKFNDFLPQFTEKMKKKRLDLLFLGIIVILTIIIYFLKVNWYYSFLSSDPYKWFYDTQYLKNYGTLDYYEIKAYPAGFVLFNAGALLPINDFMLNYFFLKYMSFFFLLIIVFSIYTISNKIFNKKHYSFLTCILFLGFSHILERSLLTVPSIMAVSIGFILVLLLNKENNYGILIFKGLLLGCIFLYHPLIAAFYIIAFFLFELLSSFMNTDFKLKNYVKSILIYLKQIIIITISIVLVVLPFIINQIFHNPFQGGFINNYLYFFGFSINFSSQLISGELLNLVYDFIEFWIIRGGNQLFKNILNIPYGIEIHNFYRKVISFGLIFVIISFFLSSAVLKRKGYIKNKNNNQRIIFFVKTTFFLAFVYYFVLGTLRILEIKQLSTITGFLDRFQFRILEAFEGLWSILLLIGLIYSLSLMEKLYKKIKIAFSEKSKRKNEKHKRKVPKYFLIILILCSFLYYTNYQRIYYHSYYPDNRLTETFWAMGNYFEEQPEDETYIMLIQDFHPSAIYRLLYQENLDIVSYKFNESSVYNDLNFNSTVKNFIMFSKSLTSDSFKNSVNSNFKIIYENSEYYFGIKKE